MKKIVGLLFVVGLVLIGCASVPLTPDGESLDGVWMREDGATITFDGNKWETVDLTNGSAGYGTFKFIKNDRIQFTNVDIMNLKYPISSEHYRSIQNGKRLATGAEIKEFQIKAWEEFNKLYPERILQYDSENHTREYSVEWGEPTFSYGGAPRDFILEGNKLTLIKYYPSPESSFDRSYMDEIYKGTFIRQ